jgi:hypothetical protein
MFGHNQPMVTYTPRCPAKNLNGRMCSQPAGSRTNHRGYGHCAWHKGAQKNIEETWAMAQELAAEQNITPQQVLLNLVRTAAGRAAWVDTMINGVMHEHVANGGDPLNPPPRMNALLKLSRDERDLASKTAKQAVDAGVMVALERRLDLEGELVAHVLSGVLDALDLTQEQRMQALGTAQHLLLEAGQGSDSQG